MDSTMHAIRLLLAGLLRECTIAFLTLLFLPVCISLGCRFQRWRHVTTEPLCSMLVIDSGASNYVCHDRSRLKNYKRHWMPGVIDCALGWLWVAGIGDMEIPFFDRGGNVQYETIYGVQHMPNYDCLLLSTEQLKAQGIFYSSEKQILYRRPAGKGKRIELAEVVREQSYPALRRPAQKLEDVGEVSRQSRWLLQLSGAWACLKQLGRGYSTPKPTETDFQTCVRRLMK